MASPHWTVSLLQTDLLPVAGQVDPVGRQPDGLNPGFLKTENGPRGAPERPNDSLCLFHSVRRTSPRFGPEADLGT
ncbi:MAG: hypothetical protein RLZ45_398 [Verrucomicrobiota bacterium]